MTDTTATLANWRQSPFNTWSFGHVDKLIPVANISAATASPLLLGSALNTTTITAQFENRSWSFDDVLAETETDGLLVLHKGRIVHECYRNGAADTRHILFSVSKSVTGILAGILVADGTLNPEAAVTYYVPEVAGSAYGNATVRHVLDMTVGISFDEDYLDAKGAFARYRAATGWNPPSPHFTKEGLHQFLATLPPDGKPHGDTFHYVSPNSDLLGWIIERAGKVPLPQQLSQRLWQPMGAGHDAYVTVDAHGASRTAGGICVTLRDLARLGEMVRQTGKANGQQVVPESWIADMWAKGDPRAWAKGDMVNLFPKGRYRSQWYVSDEVGTALCAIGIHGQWIYIDPKEELVIVKQSSQRLPSDLRSDLLTLALFQTIARTI